MMLTRCPACQTAFRVRPDQLRLRQGRVRCGTCGKAFNALESLLEEQAEALENKFEGAEEHPRELAGPAAPEATTIEAATEPAPRSGHDSESRPEAQPEPGPAAEPESEARPETEPATTSESRSSVFVLEEAAGPEISSEALRQDTFTPVTPDDSADLLIESFQRYRPHAALPLSFTGVARSGAATESATQDADTAGAEATAAEEPAAPGETDFLADADADLSAQAAARQSEVRDVVPGEPYIGSAQPEWPELHRQDESPDAQEKHSDAPGIPALLAERQEGDPADDSFEAREAEEMAATPLLPPELAAEEPATPANDAALETLDETPGFELEPTTRPRTWAWGLGIGVLVIGLLAQGTILYRQDIMQRLPQSRPLYAQLCAQIGCSMALPQEASKIAIESSDLHPEPGVASFFRLRATIRNRASFEQAYPHLELTLTDATDRPLARKVLNPAQWRPEEAPAEGFPAGSDIEVNVPFEARDVAAVGYRIYVFYP